jgi:hypothetical protein
MPPVPVTENRSHKNGQNNLIVAQCATATETVAEVATATVAVSEIMVAPSENATSESVIDFDAIQAAPNANI